MAFREDYKLDSRLRFAMEENVLDEFASDLRSSLNLSYLLPHLMERKLLTTSEEQRLLEERDRDTRDENNTKFICYLKARGSHAFTLFLEALRDETEHLGHVNLYERMSQRAKSVGIIPVEALSRFRTISTAAHLNYTEKILSDILQKLETVIDNQSKLEGRLSQKIDTLMLQAGELHGLGPVGV